MERDTKRGAEHVRIKGTTEELGEIVPPPVQADTHVEVEEDYDADLPEGAEPVHLDEDERR